MSPEKLEEEIEEARRLRHLVRAWVETADERERAELMASVLDILDAHPEDEG